MGRKANTWSEAHGFAEISPKKSSKIDFGGSICNVAAIAVFRAAIAAYVITVAVAVWPTSIAVVEILGGDRGFLAAIAILPFFDPFHFLFNLP